MVEKLVQAKMPKIAGRKKDDISEKDEFSLPQIVSYFEPRHSQSTKAHPVQTFADCFLKWLSSFL